MLSVIASDLGSLNMFVLNRSQIATQSEYIIQRNKIVNVFIFHLCLILIWLEEHS